MIHIEHTKPPAGVRPFGAPGVMPSRTLYIDPDAVAKANRGVGCIITFFVLVPFLIIALASGGGWMWRSCKGAIRPFPVSCDANTEITVSGNWEGPGPIVTNVGHNCKLHIKDSKLKGAMLLKTDASNLELTLDNVTLETTGDTMISAGSGLKAKIHGSTLTSNGVMFDNDNNLEILELTDSTLESKTSHVFKTKYNLKVKDAQNAKIKGKKGAFDTDANLEIKMRKGTEITSSDGIAIKTDSSFKLEAEGGKIDGAGGAIVSTSGTTITGTGLTISSSKEKALFVTSGLKIDLTDSSITSNAESAIEGDSGMELTLNNVKMQGVDTAIVCKSGLKVKATKKTRIASTTGGGIATTSGADITLTDSAIEAGGKAFKSDSGVKMKMNQGARIAGKKGGIEATSSFVLDGTGASIDGGSGAGISVGYGPKISFKQGSLKGIPAMVSDRKPTDVELDGTKVDGELKFPAR